MAIQSSSPRTSRVSRAGSSVRRAEAAASVLSAGGNAVDAGVAGGFPLGVVHPDMVSVAGVEGEPVKQDEMVLEIGGADTFEAFSDNLRGLSPGEENEFDVPYPADYGAPRLAGKTVRFHATVKGVQKKELPELNDEFAQDLGDYRNLEELREAVR